MDAKLKDVMRRIALEVIVRVIICKLGKEAKL